MKTQYCYIKDPPLPPLDFSYGNSTQNQTNFIYNTYCYQKQQKGRCTKKEFLKSFMKIIVFGQSHHSKSMGRNLANDK